MLGDAIIGHSRQKELLQKSLDRNRVASAYLFCGPAGVGKRLLALEFLKFFFCERKKGCGECVNCKKMEQGNHPDLLFLAAEEGTIRIDEVRLIQKHLKYHPLEAPRKVCLIDDAERMTPAAQSAFLKTLEEPSDSTLFILVSSQPEALLPTIRSRCQDVLFGRLPRDGMVRYLIQHQGLEEMEARLLAAIADGSLARALKEGKELKGQDRRQLLEAVAALPPATDNVLPLFLLSRRLAERKEAKEANLELLQLFFRDILFVLEGRSAADLINVDLAELVRGRARRETSASVLAKLEALQDAVRALEGNANLQLCMDVLLMRLSRPAE